MIWRDHPIAILDCETDGVDPSIHRIVEVAVVTTLRGEVTGRFSRLVNPGEPIPAEATAIHGITDAMVADAPTFAGVAVELAAVCEGHLLAGFNARFDLAMVVAEYLRSGLVPPPWTRANEHWLDLLVWSRVYDTTKRAGYHKLGAVAARLGVPLGTAHRALGDCETTAGILAKFADDPRLMHDDWTDLIMAQQVYAAEDEASFLRWKSRQPRRSAA